MSKISIAIVSDVVCPWCIVGYLKLQKAIENLQRQQSLEIDISWHPFELAPDMTNNGENLRDFLANKYGASATASQQIREQLTQLGDELGFSFNFSADMKRYNTFNAHQLLAWAAQSDRQTPLKLALFKAYFTDHLDISDPQQLSLIAGQAGLDAEQALQILTQQSYAQTVRDEQQQWIDKGINSVPSSVVENSYLITGAQDSQTWEDNIKQIIAQLTT